MNMNMKSPMSSGSNMKRNIIIVVVVLVILALIGMGGFMVKRALFSTEGAVQGDKYQAVFLTNGQVYFGKVSNVDNDYVKVTDIYYLQVQQSVQPEENQDQAEQQPQVSLTKLGSELHGPEDSMYVSRDQVLFWENLKNDSKVVEAIKEHKKQ